MASSILTIRLSRKERALLEAASAQARTSVSDYVRGKALEAAAADALEGRFVAIPAKDWRRFRQWAAQPAREVDGLKDLASKAPTWRR